ncbi:MAG: DNA-3-methyladenine glycosylase I [Pseudomonadota bacterium]
MSAMSHCPWAGDDAQYIAYHNTEWGVPNGDDQALFEKVVLEGFQAGLSWITILRKREHFRKVFDRFDAARIARYRPAKIEKLMADTGIVRNRAKIEATISNAQAYLEIQQNGSFAGLLWDIVDGRITQNHFATMADVPAETAASKAMSKRLKGLGFRFVGPTTMYAFMQSMGMVNDHLVGCPRRAACAKLAETFKAPTYEKGSMIS